MKQFEHIRLHGVREFVSLSFQPDLDIALACTAALISEANYVSTVENRNLPAYLCS